MLARDLGARWSEHSYALAAFKAGVAALLSRYLLDGDELDFGSAALRPDLHDLVFHVDLGDVPGHRLGLGVSQRRQTAANGSPVNPLLTLTNDFARQMASLKPVLQRF